MATDARSTGWVARTLSEPPKASPDPVAVLRGHTVDVTTLAFSDTLLASGCAAAAPNTCASVCGRGEAFVPFAGAHALTRARGSCSDADGHLKLWDLELRRAVSRR